MIYRMLRQLQEDVSSPGMTLSSAQRERLRIALRGAVLGYKRGWTEEGVLDAIDGIIPARPYPDR